MDQENKSLLPSSCEAGRGRSAVADRVRSRSGSGSTDPSSTGLTGGSPHHPPRWKGRILFLHLKHSRPIPFAHFISQFYLRVLLTAGLIFFISVPSFSQTTDPNPEADAVGPVSAAAPDGSFLKQKIDLGKEQLSKWMLGTGLSGFVDFKFSDRTNIPHVASLGYLEIDLSREFGKNFQAAGSVVADPENGVFLSVGFVDYHFFGGLIAPRGRLFTEKGFHLQAGRFDVPFGNDWQYYATKDRNTIFPALTTDMIMGGGYNDYGGRVLGNAIEYNYTVYCLRGVGKGAAYGGRFGFTPFNNPYTLKRREAQTLEIGFSFLTDRQDNRRSGYWAYALDAESKLGPVHTRLESVRRDDRGLIPGDPGIISSGAHLTQSIKLPIRFPLSVTWRAERMKQRLLDENMALDNSGGKLFEVAPLSSPLNRLTFGIGFPLTDLFLLKVDYMQFVHTPTETLETGGWGRRSVYGQLVFMF